MPPSCLACQARIADHDALCARCWSGITFIGPPFCDTLGIPLPYDIGGPMISPAALVDPPPWTRARAVALYDGVMRDLIHGLKFQDRHEMRRRFGTWLIAAGAELLGGDETVLIPVPMSRWGLIRRRFNQAAVLAREVARRTGHPYAPLALLRTRRTASQVGLSRAQRRQNVRGAFAVPLNHRSAMAGKHVVLIDDVMTTGATARACARALLRGGARQVDVLTLALVGNAGSN